MPTWKRRFFVLQNYHFFYFNDEYRTVCLGKDFVVAVNSWDRKPLGILLTSGSGRVFKLKCDTQEDKNAWMVAFRCAAEGCPAGAGSKSFSEDCHSEPADGGSMMSSIQDLHSSPSSGSDSGPSQRQRPRASRGSIGVNNFKLISTLGKGGFGKVLKVSKLNALGEDTGNIFAMKILKKEFILKNKMKKTTMLEREILLNISHPFIVKLYYSFQSAHKLYMVMEYYGGGSLYYHLEREGRFEENMVRFFGAEMLLAVRHLHQNGVVYRDLKLENVLLDSRGHIALTDFGLSKEIDPSKGLLAKTFCGTPLYVAPEMVFRRKYGFEVDWWAFGIIMYELCCGRVPFASRTAEKVLWKIVNSTPNFFSKEFFSDDSQSLIENLLRKNPTRRLGSGLHGAEQIMHHPFFANFDFEKCMKKEIDPTYIPPGSYEGEKNVRGVEASDTQCGDDQGKEAEEFERFTYCKSSESSVPTELRNVSLDSVPLPPTNDSCPSIDHGSEGTIFFTGVV